MATEYEKLGRIISISCFIILVGGFTLFGSYLILITYNIYYSLLFILGILTLTIFISKFYRLLNKKQSVKNYIFPILAILGLLFVLSLAPKYWINEILYIIIIFLGIFLITYCVIKSTDITKNKEYKNAIDSFNFVKGLEIAEKEFSKSKFQIAQMNIIPAIFELSEYIGQYDKIIKYEQLMQTTTQLQPVFKIFLLLSTYAANICLKNFDSLKYQKEVIYKLLPKNYPKDSINSFFELEEIYIMLEQNKLNEAISYLNQKFEKTKKFVDISILYGIYYDIYLKMNDINNARKYIQMSIDNFNPKLQSYTKKMILIDKLNKLGT